MSISNEEAVELFLRVKNEGYKPDRKIRKSLGDMKRLDLNWQPIDSLEWLGWFPNLTTLFLGGTQITSLKGISQLKDLKSLNLESTAIISLTELSKLTNLKSLNLSKTNVLSLEELSQLTNLQKLYLGGTQITSLKGLSQLKELKLLNLQFTRITSLEELGQLTKLTTLDLEESTIISLKGLSLLPNLQDLNLHRTNINSLKELEPLTNLQKLYLGDTQISSLKELGSLTTLSLLDLQFTRIDSLAELSGLTNLQELCLADTQISSIKELGGLTNLQTLSLADTQVRSLEGLGKLSNLQTLSLAGTQVNSLEELSGLTNLQSLNLSDTQVTSLEKLSGLTNLQALNLTRTPVRSLEELNKLTNLNRLYISGTSLTRIPKWLVEKKLPFITDVEWGLEPGVYMKDVRLSEQDVNLFSQPFELIETCYQEEKEVSVNEAKVIFLGDGGVGKTYTIYRIEHKGEAPKETETTPGVNITSYPRAHKATINFWDFGGQEIMHSMHRCFLTERTCYVVTVSNRWSEVTRQARRWLKNVESFAPNSKVILAVNQWEGVSAWDLDIKKLKEEFPNFVDFVPYTATDSKEIEKLKERIEEEVDKLPSVNVKFPESWTKVMESLRNMSSNYISRETYRNICKNAQLKEFDKISDLLLEWFNDLGVCFSYCRKDGNRLKLADYMLLKPEWLTNAVYIIVINGKKFAQQGCITYAGILDILNKPEKYVVGGLKYSEDERNYILEVIRKFRLSFKLKDKEDCEFVPALCPNLTPDDLHPKEFERHVRCEVRYDYLPDSVIHRLMVDSANQLNFKKCWLKGLCIDERAVCGLLAVCDMGGKDDDVLLIDVYQIGSDGKLKFQSPQSLLRILLNKLETINKELNLKSTTWICSNDMRKASFQLSTLLQANALGRETVDYTADGNLTPYKVQDLLGQVFDDPVRIDISKLDQEEKERILNELIQENLFFKSVGEKLINTSSQFTINHYHAPFNSIQAQEGVNIGGSLTGINNGEIKSTSTVTYPSELPEQLELFRNELKKLVEINEAQKTILYDAVGELIDKLNEPQEVQEKEKEKFKNLTKYFGIAEKSLGLLANFATAATFLGYAAYK